MAELNKNLTKKIKIIVIIIQFDYRVLSITDVLFIRCKSKTENLLF